MVAGYREIRDTMPVMSTWWDPETRISYFLSLSIHNAVLQG